MFFKSCWSPLIATCVHLNQKLRARPNQRWGQSKPWKLTRVTWSDDQGSLIISKWNYSKNKIKRHPNCTNALTSKRNAQFQERSTPFDWSEILSPKPRGANNINNSWNRRFPLISRTCLLPIWTLCFIGNKNTTDISCFEKKESLNFLAFQKQLKQSDESFGWPNQV